MNNPEDLKPKTITINIILIILFILCLIDNVSSLYDNVPSLHINHIKFGYNMIFAILDLCLVVYNTKDLFNKTEHNKKLEQIKH
jgi:hypothetical protein